MSDDDWDAEDFEPPSVTAAAPETWSDEEGHDVKKEEAASAAPKAAATVPSDAALRPKQLAKQKLAEREAKEREAEAARAKAAAAAAKSSVLLGDERGLMDGARGASKDADTDDKAAAKLRLRQLEEEADFENAQGIFDMSKSKKALADGPAADSIDAFIARNAADGDRLADKVAAKLLQFENAPFFVPMLKSLMKQATASLDSESVKEVAATVQVIANDKLKAERDKQKGKKKAPSAASKKASIAQSHNPAFDNTDEYGNFGDDDFM